VKSGSEESSEEEEEDGKGGVEEGEEVRDYQNGRCLAVQVAFLKSSEEETSSEEEEQEKPKLLFRPKFVPKWVCLTGTPPPCMLAAW